MASTVTPPKTPTPRSPVTDEALGETGMRAWDDARRSLIAHFLGRYLDLIYELLPERRDTIIAEGGRRLHKGNHSAA
jgi:hypothetical protein